jgi:serine phosphatase RsbU (regulator of sigma subunit)
LQIAEAISRSSELESLNNAIVRLFTMLVGVEQCAILLWDDETSSFVGAAMYDAAEGESDSFDTVILQTGDWTALDAVHIGMEELETDKSPPWILRAKRYRSMGLSTPRSKIYPLVAKGRLLGVLVAVCRLETADSVTVGREELQRNIAQQSAMAIDSILVYMAQQEEAWVNTALLQVAEAVNKLTDLNEILNTIVRMLPLLVGVKSSVVLVWDEETQAYRTGPSHGLTEMGQGLLESFEVDLSEFPLVEKRDVVRAGPDTSTYQFRVPPWLDRILGSETADIFPLRARGRLVGALVVGPTTDGRRLSGRRLYIVTGIAHQAAVAVVNDQLYLESAERSRMEQELNVARSIQTSLIPTDDPIVPGCSVTGYWEAAREVSGDFYDYYNLSDRRWGIAIADVADKGVPAALFMALSRTILRTVAYNRKEPAETLKRANRIIYGDTSSDLFVTAFYAVWNSEENTLTYASGGHNPPLLIRSDGSSILLRGEGIALGILEDVEIEEEIVDLNPGDVVVFYTDGVTEAINEDYDEFGLERLRLVAKNVRAGEVSTIVNAIREAINDHAGATPQYDDITLVVMKCV